MTTLQTTIDWKLLEIFSGGHFGFGRYGAPLWLVGPGSDVLGTSVEVIRARLQSWHRRGQREIDDLRDFHSGTDRSEWFGAAPRIHRTWGKLARFVLAYNGEDTTDDAVRRFQADRFGRRNGETCLLHLLALNPDGRPWPLSDSPSPFLAQASAFVERYAAHRARHILSRIQRHHPPIVVFFGRTHRPVWDHLAGAEFNRTSLSSCLATTGNGTKYLMLRHPESVGTTNEYFRRAGLLAAKLAST